MRPTLSVILPIYYRNDAAQLKAALQSILTQTRLPEEVLVVTDGPVPASLKQVIDNLQFSRLAVARRSGKAERTIDNEKLPVEVIFLPREKNKGLGETLRVAVEHTQCDYVARMDADDICMPDRFEKQMRCFEEQPELSVVGGQIAEFDGEVTNITGRRTVPLQHDDIYAYMKSRNGMNHVTVIFKRKDLLAAGNYQRLNWLEDYYLWVRMLQQGFRFRNIPDEVVLVRAGKAQIDRRGGWEYFHYERQLFRYMRSQHFISWGRYLQNLIERCCVRLLMPLTMRYWFYRRFLRAIDN